MTTKAKTETLPRHELQPKPGFAAAGRLPVTVAAFMGLCLIFSFGCSAGAKESNIAESGGARESCRQTRC